MDTNSNSQIESNIPDYCQVIKIQGSDGQQKQLLLPRKLDLERPKRARTQFSTFQLSVLEDAFTRSHYLSAKEKKELSKELKLTETQVSVTLSLLEIILC
ncbi:Homeobox domain and Homeodomain-like and Homeodomain: metazoa-containing protein [Dinothrombium tinctorium]|uniref:Homeobox domain and Homeodomain-like and Homeodomain: metazoa-containing protein n=1 Tax=Dinothrombium tinctorium TaxID=1965070 RepID=A0A3S3RWU2_9ACAR|nr:Homeobox domain and Homeodomain-like and Homeodomain: metazoa-containing protein [Dinothrombium tinctorium]